MFALRSGKITLSVLLGCLFVLAAILPAMAQRVSKRGSSYAPRVEFRKKGWFYYGQDFNRLSYYKDAFDRRPFNLGFTMGLNVALVKMKQGHLNYTTSAGPLDLKQINVNPAPGFFVGLIANVKLSNNFDLRFIPAVQLQQRNFDYVLRDSTFHRKLETSYLDLPILLKFKSNFSVDHRVYVMFGPKFSFNLASGAKVRNNPDLIKVAVFDFSLDFAFGVDLYGDRVKLSPEIRYSLGLKNLYTPDFTSYGNNITMLTTQTITICFNFE